MRDVLTKSTKASTMMHELVSQDFLKEGIAVPSCLDEERQIGALFAKLDDLIALHQRKLDALKKIKSALLEKMFQKMALTFQKFVLLDSLKLGNSVS